MKPLVLTNSALQSLVTDALQAAAGAVAGVLNGAYVGLVAATFVSDPVRVAADLTEPTYATYARKAVTWGAAELLSNGRWGALGTGVLSWSIGAADAAVTLFGYGIYSAATGGALLGTALFDAPYTLSNSTNVCALVPEVALPSSNDWGTAAQLG